MLTLLLQNFTNAPKLISNIFVKVNSATKQLAMAMIAGFSANDALCMVVMVRGGGGDKKSDAAERMVS